MNENAQEAAAKAGKQAKQVKDQGKAAAKSGGKALKAVSEEVAEDTTEKFEEVADEAVETAKKINVGVLGRMSSDTGIGFLALSVSIYAGVVAYTKFRQVASGSSQIVS